MMIRLSTPRLQGKQTSYAPWTNISMSQMSCPSVLETESGSWVMSNTYTSFAS